MKFYNVLILIFMFVSSKLFFAEAINKIEEPGRVYTNEFLPSFIKIHTPEKFDVFDDYLIIENFKKEVLENGLSVSHEIENVYFSNGSFIGDIRKIVNSREPSLIGVTSSSENYRIGKLSILDICLIGELKKIVEHDE